MNEIQVLSGILSIGLIILFIIQFDYIRQIKNKKISHEGESTRYLMEFLSYKMFNENDKALEVAKKAIFYNYMDLRLDKNTTDESFKFHLNPDNNLVVKYIEPFFKEQGLEFPDYRNVKFK